MRPLLASLATLLALASSASAAAPPASRRTADRIDFVFLGDDRPYLIRFHVRVGDKPYGAAWNAFMDKLFVWFDKDGDGVLSKAEAARLPIPDVISYAAQGALGSFTQTVPLADLDTNQDGKVSKAEFRAYYRNFGFSGFNFLAQTGRAAEVQQLNDALLSRLDPKGDGRLTAAKVADLAIKLRPLDEDDDEMIVPAELIRGTRVKGDSPPAVLEDTLRRVEPGLTAGIAQSLLTKYDRDKDGKLSRKEIGFGEFTFSRLDADKDRLLSLAELATYLDSGAPDLVFRLRFGEPPAGILGRTGLRAASPLGPRLTLVNEKTIDPALKKGYRRGPGDGLAIRLGNTTLTLQMHQAPEEGGPARNVVKASYLSFYDQIAGKKRHLTRADLPSPSYLLLLSSFSQADKDADGKLTRIELIDWLDLLSTARGVELALNGSDEGRSLFDVLDADADGRLSAREMRTAWKRLGPLAKGGTLGQNDLPRSMRLDIRFGGGRAFGLVPVAGVTGRPRLVAPAWFRKMDRNNDGDISPREWLGSDEDFKAIDADGDGLLSAAEAIAFDKKKKAKE